MDKVKSLLFLFLFLGVTLTPFVSAEVEPSFTIPKESTLSFPFPLKPNSYLSHIQGQQIEIRWTSKDLIDYILVGDPDKIRITIYNPTGEEAYMIYDELEEVKTVEMGHWLVTVDDYDLRIPAFATPGIWKAEVMLYYEIWELGRQCAKLTIHYTVREGSIWDNVFAPFYIHTAPGLLSDGFSIRLPGLFWLASPIIFIIFIIITARIWKISILASLGILRGEKKDVKKN